MRGLASPHPFLGATWGVVRALLSWLVLVCVLPYVTLLAHCALVFGYVSVGKDCAVSPWFWCSGVLPCALVYGYVHMGKDCPCLSVVLVLGFTALRVGVRVLLMGKVCACLLWSWCSARWCTDTAYGQGLASPWSWCSARVARIGARI